MTVLTSRILTALIACSTLLVIPFARALEETIVRNVPEAVLLAIGVVLAAITGIGIWSYYQTLRRAGSTRSFCALHATYITAISAALVTQCVAVVECLHLVTYGSLAGFAVLALRPLPALRAAGLALVIASAVSLADEGIQSITPRRVFDIRDLVLNFCGAILGIVITTPLYLIKSSR